MSECKHTSYCRERPTCVQLFLNFNPMLTRLWGRRSSMTTASNLQWGWKVILNIPESESIYLANTESKLGFAVSETGNTHTRRWCIIKAALFQGPCVSIPFRKVRCTSRYLRCTLLVFCERVVIGRSIQWKNLTSIIHIYMRCCCNAIQIDLTLPQLGNKNELYITYTDFTWQIRGNNT